MASTTSPFNRLTQDLIFDVSRIFDQDLITDTSPVGFSAESQRLAGIITQPVSTSSIKYNTAKSFIASKGASDEVASTFALLVLNISKITKKSVLQILREVDKSELSFNDATFSVLNSIKEKRSQLFNYHNILNTSSLNRNIHYFYKSGPNFPPFFTSDPVTTGVELDLYTYNVTVNDINDDEDLFITASVLPSWLTFTDHGNKTATLTGTPQDKDTGNNSVTLIVKDSRTPQMSGEQTFVIDVTDINQEPFFTSTPVTSASQDSLYTYNITADDPDASDTLTFTNDTALPTWLTLTDNGNRTATLSGTPSNSDVGFHNIDLRVTDDGTGNLSDTQSFTIEVVNVDDPPQFDSSPVTTGAEGDLYEYNIVTSDPDTIHGDTLTITSDLTLPTWLTLIDNGNGTGILSGTPGFEESGDYDIELRVTDSTGLFDTQVFIITVSETNLAPEITSSPVTNVTSDELYSYNITVEDVSPPGDISTITADTVLPPWLTLVDNGDNTADLTGTPDIDDEGETFSVTIRATDSGGLFDTQSFDIDVTVQSETAIVFGGNQGWYVIEHDGDNYTTVSSGQSFPVANTPWSDGHYVVLAKDQTFNLVRWSEDNKLSNIIDSITVDTGTSIDPNQIIGRSINGKPYIFMNVRTGSTEHHARLFTINEDEKFVQVDQTTTNRDRGAELANTDGDVIVVGYLNRGHVEAFDVSETGLTSLHFEPEFLQNEGETVTTDWRELVYANGYFMVTAANNHDPQTIIFSYDRSTGFTKEDSFGSGSSSAGIWYDGNLLYLTRNVSSGTDVIDVYEFSGGTSKNLIYTEPDDGNLTRARMIRGGELGMYYSQGTNLRSFRWTGSALALNEKSASFNSNTSGTHGDRIWLGPLAKTVFKSRYLESSTSSYGLQTTMSEANNSSQGTMSFIIDRRDVSDTSVDEQVFHLTSGGTLVIKIMIIGNDSFGTNYLTVTFPNGSRLLSNDDVFDNDGIYACLVSWNFDTGVNATRMYVNDVSVYSTSFTSGDGFPSSVSYSTVDGWAVGSDDPSVSGNNSKTFALRHFSFNETYINFNTTSNRRKFFNSDGIPIYGGYDGDQAYGQAPLIWAPNADLTINRGRGDDFSVVGVFSDTPPNITSEPVTTATESVAYTYNFESLHIEDELAILDVTAPVLPAWLTLTDNGDGTATLSGTPASGDVGSNDVTLRSTNTDTSAFEEQVFVIEVAAA